jgi:hypothetical protein
LRGVAFFCGKPWAGAPGVSSASVTVSSLDEETRTKTPDDALLMRPARATREGRE